MADTVLGIDLGTTTTTAAVMVDGSPTIIPNARGERSTPSVVAITENHEPVVGTPAKSQVVERPYTTVPSILRYLRHPSLIELRGKQYAPEQLLAFLLEKVKSDAESACGKGFEQAAITVPTNFDLYQREAVKQASELAGIEPTRIVNNTSAVAMGYWLDEDSERTVLVGDLGGGTFDVAVLDLGGGVYEVISTAGSIELGGNDWDWKVVEWLLDQMYEHENVDLRNNQQALRRLKQVAESGKIALSEGRKSVSLKAPALASSGISTRGIRTNLSAPTFEGLTYHLVLRAMESIADAIDRADYNPRDIDEFLLVGQSSKLPQIRKTATELFSTPVDTDTKKSELTALGTAVTAGIRSGTVDDVVLLDVTTVSVGIETSRGLFQPLVDRGRTVPTEESVLFKTARDGQSSVEVRVYQGEREHAKNNDLLKKFTLADIQSMEAGFVQIEITANVDEGSEFQLEIKNLHGGTDVHLSLTDDIRYTEDRVTYPIPTTAPFATDEQPQLGPAEENERTTTEPPSSNRASESTPRPDTELISQFLPVRNNLNRALQQEAENNVQTGIEATLKQLDHALEAAGLTFINPTVGTKLDPHRHRAIQQVDSNYSSGVITGIDQIGYETDRHVLQPAKVTVSR